MSSDEVLLEQLIIARRIKKRMKLMSKVTGDDSDLMAFMESNDKRIIFLETMIQDKSLLKKKPKKKKKKKTKGVHFKTDMKHQMYRFCRDMIYYTMFSYKISSSVIEDYFKKIRKRDDSI